MVAVGEADNGGREATVVPVKRQHQESRNVRLFGGTCKGEGEGGELGGRWSMVAVEEVLSFNLV